MSIASSITPSNIILNFAWKGPSSKADSSIRVGAVNLAFKDTQKVFQVRIPEEVSTNKTFRVPFKCLKVGPGAFPIETTVDLLKVSIERVKKLTLAAGFFEKPSALIPGTRLTVEERVQGRIPKVTNHPIKLEIPDDLEAGQTYCLLVKSNALDLTAKLVKDKRADSPLTSGLKDLRLDDSSKEGKKEKATSFNWQQKLKDILNPSDGIHNPGAQVYLGWEMIKKGLYLEAFQMMADKTPLHYKKVLQEMFFPQAIRIMHSQKANPKLMISCAKLLGRNSEEVEVLVKPPEEIELPKDLQARIDEAKKLPDGPRDVRMPRLAQEVIGLGLYDKAFDLMFNWTIHMSARNVFFRVAATKMIKDGVSYEKIVQLAKKIKLDEPKILNVVVGIYAQNDQIEFACQLSTRSNRPDYYLEIVFSALLNIKKKEEAKRILSLVSSAKREDLELFLRQ